MSTVQIEQLVKRFAGRDGTVAVDHVDLRVEEGNLLVLLGPSGCGKTTLLRCVAGLEEAQEGRITLGNAQVFDASRRLDIPTHKRDIGFVFQNYSLWPHMTVRQNVEYPLKSRGMDKAQRAQRVNEVLDKVQCLRLADRIPVMLSGGQQQRIALARALAARPSVLLLDEPLSNLDALLRVDLRAHLRELHREFGFTGIYVTHDQAEAFALGTYVAVMNSGRIDQLGTPSEVYDHPATEFVARFLGISNSLSLKFAAEKDAAGYDALARRYRLPGAAGEDVAAYIRPQKLRIARPAQAAADAIRLGQARVTDAIYGGGEFSYVVHVGELKLLASGAGENRAFERGDEVDVVLPHDELLVYANGRLVRPHSAN